MTISDEILIIANRLANQGKKPSVALVKTKLTQQVPLPTIIQTLKTWQHDPEFIATANQATTETKASTNLATAKEQEIQQAIALAIAPLQQEVAQLKEQVALLLTKMK
ncbi:hypothetical protein [Thalassotalea sp. PLHSN55]|uniref:hypothetical protein n=1 Tax=Thalassotalea sp. PLHSN55 TaxID=3435888 RepID=UPI003F870C99